MEFTAEQIAEFLNGEVVGNKEAKVWTFAKIEEGTTGALSFRSNMKYALGTLNAGGEMFTVTIFVNYTDTDYRIQHLKIERMN